MLNSYRFSLILTCHTKKLMNMLSRPLTRRILTLIWHFFDLIFFRFFNYFLEGRKQKVKICIFCDSYNFCFATFYRKPNWNSKKVEAWYRGVGWRGRWLRDKKKSKGPARAKREVNIALWERRRKQRQGNEGCMRWWWGWRGCQRRFSGREKFQ
jgi:hypothetical protein